MLFYTLYYFVSIMSVLGSLELLTFMILFRVRGLSITGKVMDPRHPAFKSVKAFTSSGRIAVVCVLILIFAANLWFSAAYLLGSGYPDAKLVFWAAPVINIVTMLLILRDARNRFGHLV